MAREMAREREWNEPVEAEPARVPMHERVGQMDKEIFNLQEQVQVLRNTVDRLMKIVSRELGE